MSRPLSLLAIVFALAALAGCSGGDGDAQSTTTTTAARADLPKLTAVQSRRAAGELLDRWSAEVVRAAKKLQEREAAANKALREPYYKADAQLRASMAKIDRFPSEAKRASGRWVPESLAIAVTAAGEAWRDWGQGILDIRSAAAAGKTPDDLSQTSLLSHLAAYRAAKRTAPLNFRQASRYVRPQNPSAFSG
jgi:hypothetical protein